ncbi:Ubiquitin carboxyl-terminal hydrolase [Zostera marina]|uniref:Ubiquitin carboxyl-terminal hydrolase n=1 Tax=Zostera marina TaxID=29655 RepID=A0A0K9Q4A9_ZOSMR|nr:Ubiquitin carboxyl-terminal hydrolase [Zostera marina]
MYALRIHSLDTTARESASSGETSGSSSSSSQSSTIESRNPNLNLIETKGVVHLYRVTSTSTDASSSTSSEPHPILPPYRGRILFALSVPSSISIDGFLEFCGSLHANHCSEIRFIRNDGAEDRYSVLITLYDQRSADIFYRKVNGWTFPPADEDVCHLMFVSSVEFTDAPHIASIPPTGCTELPTCPVCLERLDQDTGGIVTTDCDHSYQCSCVSKWMNSSCPVCRFCQEHVDKPNCSVCETEENIWICLICSFIGCGRYKDGHAIKHWKDTQHCYSLDVVTQRVWDYAGDTYVHRLNLSKTDGKLVKEKHTCGFPDGNSEDSAGIDGTLFASQVEAIKDEYDRLLESQSEDQRRYYESLIKDAEERKKDVVDKALEKAKVTKLQDIEIKIKMTIEEKNSTEALNEELRKEQKVYQEKYKEHQQRQRVSTTKEEERLRDVEEQVWDYKHYIESQKVLRNMENYDEDIKDGTVLPMPPSSIETSIGKTNKPSGSHSQVNRRRR